MSSRTRPRVGGGRAAVISTHRLQEGISPLKSPDAFRTRMVKEAIHELGNTFNLRLCRDASCIMNYCRTVGDVDKKLDQLCRYCRILLANEEKKLEIS